MKTKRQGVRFYAVLILFGVFVGIAARTGWTQRPPRFGQANDPFGRELFLFSFYNFADQQDSEQSLAVFHFALVNDILTFVKLDDDQYRAGYEIGVIFYNDDDQALVERSTRGTVVANSFEETNSRVNVIREQIKVSLPPGEYKVLVRLSDEESEKQLIRRRDLTLRPFDRSGLKMSDIVFADRLDCSRIQSEDYIPNIRRVFFRSSSSFSAFWEIYMPADIDSIRLNLSLLDENNQPVFEKQKSHAVTGTPVRECFGFKEHIDHPGTYTLRVQAIAGEWSVKSQSQFHVYWGNLQLQEKNLDVAFEQMKLVADSDGLDEISDADQDQKQQWFDEFWQRRDPDPETPENELKEEFFRRVDFTNRHFSEYGFGARRTGWKTDRGRIYIRNGPPTEVERRATDFNMPTAEIWYYAKLDRRYIFTDRDGSGHFRLVKVE